MVRDEQRGEADDAETMMPIELRQTSLEHQARARTQPNR